MKTMSVTNVMHPVTAEMICDGHFVDDLLTD